MTSKQSVRFKAAITPADASNRRLDWTSSDPTVATVNNYGTVKALPVTEVKTVTITAAAKDGSGVVGEFPVTVYPVAQSITLYLDGQPVNNETLCIDIASLSSLRLTAEVFPAAARQDVAWTTSSRRTATVTDGLVQALNKGNVTITATAQDGTRLRARCKIRITVISKKVTITGPDTVPEGKTISLKAEVEPRNAGDRRVVWSSSDPSVASVSSFGRVHAGQVDVRREVTITATARDGGASASYTVTVIPKADAVAILRNGAPTNGTLFMDAAFGSTIDLSAAVSPADAAQSVKWSSNSRAVSVSQDGTITCRAVGTATITATAKDGSNARTSIYVAVGDFSGMPYYIEVDKANQVVRVYERGDGSYTHLVRRMICSSGAWNTSFHNGLYTMNGSRTVWSIAVDRQHYMQYASRINGPYMFHGVPTTAPRGNAVVPSFYKRLGHEASGGCIRLLSADAKWIYENALAGTRVLVMKGVRNPAEYGAVSAPPMVSTWDPTDDDPNNPYYDPSYTSEISD